MNDANPSIFRGVVALELRDGTPPQRAALGVAAAGDLAALLGRDLAALVPGVRDCDFALLERVGNQGVHTFADLRRCIGASSNCCDMHQQGRRRDTRRARA